MFTLKSMACHDHPSVAVCGFYSVLFVSRPVCCRCSSTDRLPCHTQTYSHSHTLLLSFVARHRWPSSDPPPPTLWPSFSPFLTTFDLFLLTERHTLTQQLMSPAKRQCGRGKLQTPSAHIALVCADMCHFLPQPPSHWEPFTLAGNCQVKAPSFVVLFYTWLSSNWLDHGKRQTNCPCFACIAFLSSVFASPTHLVHHFSKPVFEDSS